MVRQYGGSPIGLDIPFFDIFSGLFGRGRFLFDVTQRRHWWRGFQTGCRRVKQRCVRIAVTGRSFGEVFALLHLVGGVGVALQFEDEQNY